MDESFDPIDRHMAATLLRLSNSEDEELGEALRLLCHHTRNGHVCIDLRTLPPNGPGDGRASFSWRFIKSLSRSPLVGPDRHHTTPLVLEGESRLYLRRMREHELLTASLLRNLSIPTGSDPEDMRWGHSATEADTHREANDPGMRALELVRERRLVVLTGGPGTGKTTVTAAVLTAMLQAQPNLRVALAAPTGKAAARLRESLNASLQRLNATEGRRPDIPDVQTLHRLLGRRMHSASFLRNRSNPLACDIVVVDEASMVDLPLFAGLLAALPPQARLILAGDRHQLASVESGTVLGDLCSVTHAPQASGSLFDEAGELGRCIIELEKNFRFGPDSGIAELANRVRAGDDSAALRVLRSARTDLKYIPDSPSADRDLRRAIADGFSQLGESRDPAECLHALDRFRILCAHRRGRGGVEELNTLAREVLQAEGVLSRSGGGFGGLEPLPILITRNDHRLRLFNGDLGILLYDADGRAAVFFRSEESGGLRRFAPERLPEHELSFATTVHKSQGSEFAEALLVLPPESSPVLTRELVYTAITRARERFLLRGSEAVFGAAVRAAILRTSGLRRALLSNSPKAE